MKKVKKIKFVFKLFGSFSLILAILMVGQFWFFTVEYRIPIKKAFQTDHPSIMLKKITDAEKFLEDVQVHDSPFEDISIWFEQHDVAVNQIDRFINRHKKKEILLSDWIKLKVEVEETLTETPQPWDIWLFPYQWQFSLFLLCLFITIFSFALAFVLSKRGAKQITD